MSRILIVAAGAGRARLFAYLPADSAEARPAPVLTEIEDLVHPWKTAPGTRSRPGLARRPGPHVQSYDEHANQHRAAEYEAFAKDLVAAVLRLAGEHRAKRLVLVTGPHFLGALRPHHDELRAAGLGIDELSKDFTRLSKTAILAHLDAAKLLPHPEPPPAAAGRILEGPKSGSPDRS